MHIAAMADALQDYQARDKPSLEQLERVLGKISTGAKAQLGGDLSVAGGALNGGKARRGSRRGARKTPSTD